MRPLLLVMIATAAACGGPPHTETPLFGGTVVEGKAEIVGASIVSTPYNEIRLAQSPDGNTRLWGSTDRPGGPGGWNIWVARKINGSWNPPVAASFNSDANDFDPAYSPDGRYVYFFSNRPGGAGGDDIYRGPVEGEHFGAVEHLGPEVNTPGNEWAPTPSPYGAALLFASNRPGQKHDLYLARIVGDGFAPAEPLPGALNTPDHDEFDATFLPDGTSIVFARSTDADNDPIALYVSRRGPGGYDPGVALPATVNVEGGHTLGPSLDLVSEPGVAYLCFSGKRPEGGVGKLDIYRIRLAR